MQTQRLSLSTFFVRGLVLISAISATAGLIPAQNSTPAAGTASPQAINNYLHLPLAFERRGADANETWTARGQGYSVSIHQKQATIRTLSKESGQTNAATLEFAGAKSPQAVPGAELPGKVNYIYGNDPKKWQTGLATYDGVTYRELYPGVDLVYHGNQQQLEFDLVVKAGADPRAIRMKVGAGQKLSIDDKGALVIGESDLRIALPRIYQEIGGVRKVVAGRYALHGQGEAGFELDAWDRARPLVIDPTVQLQPGISFSALLGGSTGGTFGEKIALDSSGNIYIAGYTSASDLPTSNAAQGNSTGSPDGFITAVSASGNSFIYSTYIGGSGTDELLGIALDSNGDAWATGYSASFDFPIMNATQSALSGGTDAVVVELNPSGALAFSTYLGGSAADQGTGIAVDSSNNAYVTGYTNAGGSFPTTASVIQSSKQGNADIFVTKYSSAGSMVYSTLLGGPGQDEGLGIAVDSNGDVYVTGLTSSSAFVPANPAGGAQAAFGGGTDAFVAELNPAASALLYFTYLGGSGTTQGTSIALNAAGGVVYFAGFTNSAGIATAGAAETSYAGGYDGFVASFNAGAATFNYVTYLGGNRGDMIEGLAVDGSGNVYAAGSTDSTNFPTYLPLQSSLSGNTTSILQTSNSGASWSAFDGNIPGAVFDVSPDPVTSGTVVVATEQGIYLTTNSGSSWTQEVGGQFGSLFLGRSPVNPSVIYSVQGTGLTRISTNNGANWTVEGTAATASGIVADGVSAGTAYVFGNGSGVYVTTNSGVTWTPVSTGLPSKSVFAMAAGTDGAVYAVIQTFGVYKSTTQGASWTAVNNGLSGPFFATSHSIAAGPGNPSLLALTMSGQEYFSSDGANSWGGSGLPDYAEFVSNFGTDGGGNLYLYAGASDGSIYSISSVTDNWAAAGTFLTTSSFGTLAVDPLNYAHVFAVSQVPSSAFVAKLNSIGSAFSYSTYLGGIGSSVGWGVATNGSGQVYVTGNSGGQGFPITEPFLQPSYGQTDAFITVIADSAGSCTYAVNPGAETLLGNAQQVFVGVVAPNNCPWTVSGNPVWAFVAPTSSSGTGVVAVQVTANATGSTRSGTINIGGQTVTITQADSSCSYGLNQFPYFVSAGGGSFTANLTTAAGCPWAVQDNDPGAIQINSGASGSGDGAVSISVGPNNTLNQRNFSLPIGNNAISIVQDSTCGYTLKTSSVSVPSGGGSGSVTFTTNNPSCTFFPPVQNNAYWISISEPGGAINYTAAPNTGVTPRSGQLNINGSTLTINQAAQPVVHSIVNGADGSAPSLAPGSLSTIYGNYLADSTVNAVTNPLPFALGGASIAVDGYPAAILYASPTQVNFQIPYEASIGTASLVITVDGSISNTFTFSVAATAPGIAFSDSLNGSPNTPGNPVTPGGFLLTYFTGGGAATPAVADGTSPSTYSVFNSVTTATIAGSSASVEFAGLVSGTLLGQANIVVPSGLPTGSYLLVITSGGRSSKAATIYVGGPPPTVSSVTPNSTPAGSGSTPITVSGANFAGGSVVFTPPGGTATTITPSLIQAAQIAATLPAALLTSAGTAQVAIMNSLGAVSNSVPFYVTPFTISGATPNSTPAGSANTLVTVSGQNLGTATNLSFTAPGGASTSIPLSLIQSAEAQATVPSAYLTSAGTAQVALSNAAGALSNPVPFYVTPFTITRVLPDRVPIGSPSTLVTVKGSNLGTATNLSFTAPGGASTSFPLSLIASAEAQATIPAAYLTTPGTAQVQLGIGSGGLSNPMPFRIGEQSAPPGPQPSGATAYVLNENGSLVSVTSGASTPLGGTPCQECFDLARDAEGDFIVAAGNQLAGFTSSGASLSPIAAPQGSSFVSVAVDSTGNYIVVDNQKHQILRISPLNTQVVATYPVYNSAQMEDAYVRVDSFGNYILAEDNSPEGNPALTLYHITPGGQVTFIAINPANGSSAPASAGGLTFDANGNYVEVDWYNDTIFTITPSGISTPLFTDPNGYLGDPEGIARDPLSGFFFLTDDVNNTLYMFAPDGSNFNKVASGAFLASPGSVLVVDAVATTFLTSPEGLPVSIDGGVLQTAPFTQSLTAGPHMITVNAVQNGTPGTQYVFTGWSDLGPISHQISVGSSPATYTANFQTQYQLTIALSPAYAGATTPPSGTFFNAGQVVNIGVTPGSGYAFSSWTGPVANQSAATTVTMNGPQSLTANVGAAPATLFETVPAGLRISVDGGANQATPFTSQLAPGPHTIALAPTQPGPAGTQYVFTGWSDSGAASHSIVVTGTAAVYTATFKTQYQLTTIASPPIAGSVTPGSGGYYDPGFVVNLLASPSAGYTFGSWTGSVANSANAATTITMGTAAQTVTANFAGTTGITLQTSPPGLLVSVDSGAAQVAPFTANLSSGSHSIAVATTQTGAPGTQYVYTGWNDGGGASHTITVGAGPGTYTASFTTQYLVTAQGLTGGTVSLSPPSGSGYYNSGASVTVTAIPNKDYSFATFGGSLTGPTNPQNLTVTQPASITGNFIPPNPAISLSILNKTTSAGVTTFTLALTNTGGSDASAVSLTGLVASIVTGTGSVSVITPSLPAALGTITEGSTYNETVQVAITGTVTKFKLAISGSMRNTQGTLLTISGSSLIIP